MSPINLDSSRCSNFSLNRIVVLVFQQVDDLTDHNQNRTQTHKLTSILDLVGIQQLGRRFVQQRWIVQQLFNLTWVVSQIN